MCKKKTKKKKTYRPLVDDCSTVCKPSYLMVPVRTWANINLRPKKAPLSFSVPVIASAFWEIVFLPNGQHAGSKIKPPVLQASLGGLCEKSTLFYIKSFFWTAGETLASPVQVAQGLFWKQEQWDREMSSPDLNKRFMSCSNARQQSGLLYDKIWGKASEASSGSNSDSFTLCG